MQEAESQGVLSSSDDTSGAASARGNGQDSKTRLKAQSKSRQEPSSKVTEVHWYHLSVWCDLAVNTDKYRSVVFVLQRADA